nr:pre-peptidase C-terminal domain-containing protein [Leptolyngbya sp. Prado105]
MSDPGNILSTAQSLSLTTTAQPFTNSVSATDSFDHFRVTLSSRSSVNLALVGLNGDANLALIRDANNNSAIDTGEVIARSTNTGSLSELVNVANLAAGDYFIEVSWVSGATVNYSFSPVMQPSPTTAIDWRNPITGDMTIWTMNGNTIVESNTITGLNPNWQLAARGDFDNNGTSDWLWRDVANNTVRITLLNGTQVIDQGALSTPSLANWQVQVGDLNADNRSDLIWRNTSTGEVAFWVMNGKNITTSGSIVTGSSNWRIDGLGDLNGNGTTDMIMRNSATGSLVFWLMNGSSMATNGGITWGNLGLEWQLRQVGDLGVPSTGSNHTLRSSDLVWQNTNTGEVAFWLMNGTASSTTIAQSGIINPGLSWQVHGLADLNGDSRQDVVLRSSLGEVAFWLMNGVSQIGGRVQAVGTTWQIEGMRDLNWDGRADIVWRETQSGQTASWLMNGTVMSGSAFLTPQAANSQGGVRSNRSEVVPRIDEAGNAIASAFDVGALTGNGAYAGILSNVDTNDFYKFTVVTDVSYSFSLSGLAANANLQLLNSNNTVVASSTNAGIASEQLTQPLIAGTYCIRIYSESAINTSYSISFEALTPTPQLIKDIYPGTEGSDPAKLVKVGNWIYFTARDSVNGVELWKSNGTNASTMLVKDINPGSEDSNPNYLTAIGDIVYFVANDGVHGEELWKTDGTSAGTVLVKDLSTGDRGSSIADLTSANNTLFFQARVLSKDGLDQAGAELWKTDGTVNGTMQVKDINPGISSSLPMNLTFLNNSLYFTAFTRENGYELWKSDGTGAGTVLLKDINPDRFGSTPSNFRALGSTVYFTTTNIYGGLELWRTNGTTQGTLLVKTLGSQGSGRPYLTVMNNLLYFQAYDYNSGYELWKSDGTEAGTVLVKDINSGVLPSYPSYLTAIENTLYFTAYTSNQGYELWKSDGTANGTVLLKDINLGSGDSLPSNVVKVDNTLYFLANDATKTRKLWKSDGTESGTEAVSN